MWVPREGSGRPPGGRGSLPPRRTCVSKPWGGAVRTRGVSPPRPHRASRTCGAACWYFKTLPNFETPLEARFFQADALSEREGPVQRAPSLDGSNRSHSADVANELWCEVLIRSKWKVIEETGAVCILIPGTSPPPQSLPLLRAVWPWIAVFLTYIMSSMSDCWGFCL